MATAPDDYELADFHHTKWLMIYPMTVTQSKTVIESVNNMLSILKPFSTQNPEAKTD